MVGKTSMEVGVRVEAEDLMTGEGGHTPSANLTFIPLGPESKPKHVPPLIIENDEQARRSQEAQARRKLRQKEQRDEAAAQKHNNQA
jgi:acyl-CoA hydrolase